MLFKLISDGKNTRVELDGKNLGSAVTGVAFKTEVDYDGKRHTTASIDLDLSPAGFEKHAFVDAEPGEYVETVKRWERLADEHKKAEDAADEVKWQLTRAFDGTAGSITPNKILNDIKANSEEIKRNK